MTTRLLIAGLTLVAVAACEQKATTPSETANAELPAQQAADTIYSGGPILTMDDANPRAQALAVQDGRIVAVGTEDEVIRARGDSTEMVNLAGRTLMPGFIDNHSHLIYTAVKQSTVNLDPPPAGAIDSIDKLQAELRSSLRNKPPEEGRWLLGWGFDNGMLADNRFPTRKDLDEISTEVPILIMHFSTHMAVLNSRGLEVAGVTANTVAPEGGVIQRLPDSSEPNGILEETAMLAALVAVAQSARSDATGEQAGGYSPEKLVGDREQMKDAVDAAEEVYLAKGYTTIAEMAASPGSHQLLQEMAEDGRLQADVVSYLLYLGASADQVKLAHTSGYNNHYRVGGGKINLDGGTPGRTAFLRLPYFKQATPQVDPDYRGYSSIASQERMNELVASYYAADVPLQIHALGDGAVEQALEAVEFSESRHPRSNRRTQLIHLQVVGEDQFDRMADLDVTAGFQITHNFYFADFHAAETLGPERTERLNSIRSALDRGIPSSFHHDSPVHPVDQFDLVWIAVNRKSRSGRTWGADQRLTIEQALKASTIGAAYQFFEEDTKGSLEVGKLADMIIVDRDPLTTEPEELKNIEVIETIKEGETIYRRE